MKHLILDRNTDISQKNKFHIVPFLLNNQCQTMPDSKVSNYFLSTVSQKINEQTNKTELTGTIHGHKLVGQNLQNVDHLYSCSCYFKPETDDIQIVATQKIQNITQWRKDIAWKKNQGHLGSTMLYSQLMQILHSNVQQKYHSESQINQNINDNIQSVKQLKI